jgi:DNA-binding PadR family transcriptional regulator
MHAMHHKTHCGPRFDAWSMMGGGGDRGDEGRGEGRGGGRGRHGGPGRGSWGGPSFGFGPGGPGGFGPGGPGGFGPGGPGRGGPFGRPGRRRRGDVRAALLLLLEEEPRNGYGLMQEIEQRSDGEWRPSPGSVYPALSQLEDEGLVLAKEDDGRKLFDLTDAGRAHVEERRDQLGTPWEPETGGRLEDVVDLRHLMHQLGAALRQVVQEGDAAHVTEARTILSEARRRLYGLLAGEPAGDEPAEDR